MNKLTREETEALLVFYANDSLVGEERESVESALEQDAGLRGELALLRKLRAEMQAVKIRGAGEPAYFKLMKAIEQTPQDHSDPVGSAPVAGPTGWRRAAMVAALVVIAIQAAVLWRGGSDGEFGLASSGSSASLIVAFRPDAYESDIRNLLLDLELQIVSGPSSLGLYRLSGADPDLAVRALTAHPDIVESAENAND